MKIKYGDLKRIIREEFDGVGRCPKCRKVVCDCEACEDCGKMKCGCGMSESQNEVAPPGREKQVKGLKRATGIDNPYAIAWAQHKKHGKPGKK